MVLSNLSARRAADYRRYALVWMERIASRRSGRLKAGFTVGAVVTRTEEDRHKAGQSARSYPISNKRRAAMKARIDYTNVPEALRGMYQLDHYIHNSGLDESLVHLVKMRASQINGCAYCLDMHSKDARALGETEQRLYALNAWRETPFYSERERAALEWTEAITLVAESHAPDEVYERLKKQFSP